ncbi:MAG: arsenate reductase/protein-tyrosine-phosphatase family protein [Planctomycetota bacterium]|jgi:protein-tyrosine-phosphatase
MRTILFVCTANTCRSPLAEAIARHWVDKGLVGKPSAVFVASAGVAAVTGHPPTHEAIAALAAMGIDHMVSDTPEHQAKVELLDPGEHIDDPIGMGQPVYDALAKRFMDLIPRRLKETLGHEDRPRR